MVPPLDLCALAARCGAGFAARAGGEDPELWRTIADAIRHPGFAVVDIEVSCPRYDGDRKRERGRSTASGAVVDAADNGCARPEFAEVYREAAAAAPEPSSDVPLLHLHPSSLTRPLRWLIAGSVGQHVEWAAGVLLRAGAMSGSHVAQKNEHVGLPGSGADVSEVCLSADTIGDAACDEPDVVVIVSAEGLAEVEASGCLQHLSPDGLLVMDDSLPLQDTAATVIRGPFRVLCTASRAPMAAVLIANERVHAVPERALLSALRMSSSPGEVAVFHQDASRMLGRLQ